MSNRIYKYAAIDVGSNAVRLLLCNVVEEHGEIHYKKSELVRIPLRLGEDVFQQGNISEAKLGKFVKTMLAFKILIDVFEPLAFRACATASLREASNSNVIIQRVKNEAEINLDIVSGKEEAELIYSNHVEELLDHSQCYIYIDVGGGSTEITLFDRQKFVDSKSFDIGTLRFLNRKVTKECWDNMKEWVEKITSGHYPLTAIGSGGNINKIFKILDRKDKPLTFLRLKNFYDVIKKYSVEKRMEIWKLNPDRADVIVPAAKIFLTIMKTAGIKEIIVPQVGLADGIVHNLHENFVKKAKAS